MPSPRPMISLGFTCETFPTGTHMCYIFNDDAENHELITKFIESGLSDHEKTSYFTSAPTEKPIDDILKDLGIASRSELKTGQFELSRAEDVYCPDHVFVPERMLDRLRALYSASQAEGYAGARGSGEMDWALQGIPGSERLIEYEARINTIVDTHPITALCQYDARLFDGATLFEVLRVHPMMVVRGQVVRNPYYMPAEEYLERFLAEG